MLAFARWSRFAVASRLLAAAATLLVAPRVSAQGSADLAVAKKCFEDVWVRHDTTAMARCQAPSYPEHGTAGDTRRGLAQWPTRSRAETEQYPDLIGATVNDRRRALRPGTRVPALMTTSAPESP